MRKFKWVLVFVFAAWVQRTAVSPPLFLGTKTPYEAPVGRSTTAPAGYRPVFVNYVGRHGARHLTKAGADIGTLRVLDEAAGKQGLTPLGYRMRAAVKRLCLIEKGQYENITLLGAAEQRAIAQRMRGRYPGVFQGRGLDVVMTYKIRTKQSADAFLQGLGGYHGTVRMSRLPDSLDAVLRFYDLSPAYLKYKKGDVVKKGMDSVDRDARTAAVAAAVSERIFTPGYLKGRTAAEAMTFSDDLYDLFSVQFSMPGEIRERGWSADSVDLSLAFSREDLVWDDFRNGAQDFLEKGPARDPLGIQVKVAAPLLVDFVRTTDEFVAAEGKDAVLRFTHAEAISPFASLLGIPEASVAAPGIARYHDHWRAERIIPLSANIQWIIYSNGEDVRVKLLLNEREVELPIGGGPYYPWKELRGYCIERLKAVQAGMQGDMVGWLKELK
ncbi:MAG TPA: histidine-type phosphatase [Puia sp.]|uniref:histidine-type phosphatase n=1 Tax=Puia sp. TaxID=2045100 RepID=UPI002C759E50|nr:histidine-type phosphatase [Puia sp.]HVU95169.1 histidine-type phosphatase [Puia sp.]